MFRHCHCYRSIINTLEWKKRRWSLSWSVYPFYVIFGDGGARFESAQYLYLNMGVKLVMVKDQSLARSSVVRVWLWSECSGVVTDTLTLSDGFRRLALIYNLFLVGLHDHSWACFEKDKSQASIIIGRWNIKYWKSFSGLLLKTWLRFAYAHVRWKSRRQSLPEFWF